MIPWFQRGFPEGVSELRYLLVLLVYAPSVWLLIERLRYQCKSPRTWLQASMLDIYLGLVIAFMMVVYGPHEFETFVFGIPLNAISLGLAILLMYRREKLQAPANLVWLRAIPCLLCGAAFTVTWYPKLNR